VDEAAGRLHLRPEHAETMLDDRFGGQSPTGVAVAAVADVLDRLVERGLGHPQVGAGHGGEEVGRDHLEDEPDLVARSAEQGWGADLDVVEPGADRGVPAHADAVPLAVPGEPGGLAPHRDAGELAGRRGGVGRDGRDDVGVRARPVGDEALLAVDHPAFTPRGEGGLGQPELRAGAGLGERQRGEVLPRRDGAQELLALPLGRLGGDDGGGDVVHAETDGGGGAGLGDLLADTGQRAQPQARPAVLAGDDESAQPCLEGTEGFLGPLARVGLLGAGGGHLAGDITCAGDGLDEGGDRG
jgi:hypothetical protein